MSQAVLNAVSSIGPLHLITDKPIYTLSDTVFGVPYGYTQVLHEQCRVIENYEKELAQLDLRFGLNLSAVAACQTVKRTDGLNTSHKMYTFSYRLSATKTSLTRRPTDGLRPTLFQTIFPCREDPIL